MKLSDRAIKKKMNMLRVGLYEAEHLQKVVQSSKAAFYENEQNGILTGAEFLYQQAGYIRKRWWVLQGILLMSLWMLLKYAAMGNYYVQRCMGVAAPVFVILILPEMWKNRTYNATEVEGTSYFSLRQIYAARLLVFAMVDVLLLSVFSAAAVRSGRVLLEEIALQFFLPLVVTCCICFRTLYSRRMISEASSMFLCGVWSVLWLQLILNGNIYEAVAVPVWYGVLAVSSAYLLYCIYMGQRKWGEMWEDSHSG